MATAEYPEEMSGLQEILSLDSLKEFAEKHENAERIFVGDKNDVERFNSIMEELKEIKDEIATIRKHFNIVPIIGGNKG